MEFPPPESSSKEARMYKVKTDRDFADLKQEIGRYIMEPAYPERDHRLWDEFHNACDEIEGKICRLHNRPVGKPFQLPLGKKLDGEIINLVGVLLDWLSAKGAETLVRKWRG